MTRKKRQKRQIIPGLAFSNETVLRPVDEKERMIRELADSDATLNICLTNDFTFKTAFRNKKALTGLLSALLDMDPRQIADLEFPDTFVRGDYPEDREGILDIKVHLNSQKKINLEMQLLSFPYWEERSLFYLCRMFLEDIKKGEGYRMLEECIHISILGFQLEQAERFYERVRLMKESGEVYSDKLGLRMLYLNQLEKVSEEEKDSDVYRWAKLISSKDWEVLTNMAKTNEYMQAAVDELEKINMDKALRYEYLRREMQASDETTIREYYTELGEKKGREAGRIEGREAGREAGRIEGRKAGRTEGEDLFADLTSRLIHDSRTDDLLRAVNDKAFRSSLYLEYGIKAEDDI